MAGFQSRFGRAKLLHLGITRLILVLDSKPESTNNQPPLHPLGRQKGQGPTDTLILGFLSPELWENKVLLF
jgi:hypothetical protein